MSTPKLVSKYEFAINTKSTYLFVSCTGADILPLPVYVKNGHPHKGKRYIKFEANKFDPAETRAKYPYVFSLGKKINKQGKPVSERLTGVNFPLAYPNKSVGDTHSIGRNDAILFDFSENRQTLTLYIFENLADSKNALFERWTAGSLSLTVDAVPVQKESPLTA